MFVLAGVFLIVLALLYCQAAAVTPGTDYTISTQRQAAEVTPEPPEPEGPVDINAAGLDELQRLTGIGPALAQRIIDYRGEHGPFRSVEDLLEVKGIGEATLEKFREEAVAGTDEEDGEEDKAA
ncbi:MAG: helix-hairpin-helix domain-containing protein [Oscillospiraceae bacterium]|nr:helix-hairpin-helix domain-containing protein [Oscillospiraceae bacterium]